MIRDAHEHNETVTSNDFEIERLRAALPEYFDKDGAFMLNRLQESLKEGNVSITKEGYELKFLGKSYAKYLTSTKTETIIVPDLEHNSQPENKNSENLYIVGDNLDALKHLLGSYAGQVKCIYIDPPYNTGSDGFVYNDDFGFTASQLVDKIGLSKDEAERVLDLQGKSSHSAWLTFMYPRLQLAKELLTDDGVIFISIDENEQANLSLIADEVFGEMNSVGTLVWRSTPGSNTGNDLKTVTEYVVAYSKNKSLSMFRGITPDASEYRLMDDHYAERGGYKENKLDRRMTGNHYSEALNYPITMPDGTDLWPGNASSRQEHWNWRWSREKVSWGFEHDFLICKKQENGWSIYFKQYLLVDNTDTPIERTVPPQNLIEINGLSIQRLDGVSSARGNADAISVMGDKFFDYPKPVNLIRHLMSLVHPDALFLDFFSGSGTSAEAAMRNNAFDHSVNRWILVQLPERVSPDSKSSASRSAYGAGFTTIDEIARERIKRAAAKIKDETGADIDYGFRLYRLEEPPGQLLDQLERFDPAASDALFAGDYVSKFDLNGAPGHDTVLATWLVKDGYGLTASAESVKLVNYSLDVCDDSGYVIDTGLTSDDVATLVRLLETGDLGLSRVVVFGYSVEFSVMHELKKNLAVLKSGKTVDVIERF
ncbi:site-specific DNA-methyltransferase [Dermabacteraceae bacterium P13077]